MDHSENQWAMVLTAVASPDRIGDGRALLPTAVRLGLGVAPGMVGCSVTEVFQDGGRTPVWANDLSLDLDEAQYADDLGPCLDAARDGRRHLVDLSSGQPGYPSFSAAAARYGVHASLSTPLPHGPHPAALNLYADSGEVFQDPRVRRVADLLARCVAALLRTGPPTRPVPAGAVETALAHRAEVVRAQDVLVARQGGDHTTAFAELVRRSKAEQRTLQAVAREILTDGGEVR